MLPENVTTDAFALRIKPNPTAEQVPNISNGYLYFGESYTGDCKVVIGEWKTVTIDISSYADVCTEFAIYLFAGGTVYVRNITTTPEEIVVEGLQLGTDLTVHVADAVKAVKLEDGSTAYEYKALDDWNKLYICQAGAVNANALKGKNTISFEIMLPEDTTADAFALRIKPNPTDEQVPGISSGYLYFGESYTGDCKMVKGEWKTVTIDISSYADACTEFAIYLFAGTTAYVRNITIL